MIEWNWLKTWSKVIVVTLAIIAVVISTFLKFLAVDFASMLILAITLIAIIIYVHDTNRIAQANLLNTSPTVSCRIHSGKKYFNMNRCSSDEEKELFFDTRVIITNHSRFGTIAHVNLNLKINGEPVEYHPMYSGKKPWPLDPFGLLNGHFYIGDILKMANMSIEKMKEERTDENARTQLTMDVEVENEGFLEYKIKNPTQHWSFDFQKDLWESTDYYYYA